LVFYAKKNYLDLVTSRSISYGLSDKNWAQYVYYNQVAYEWKQAWP